MNTAQRTASRSKRRWVADPMAIFKTLNKLEPFSDEEIRSLALPIRISFESIRTGRGTKGDFHDIAAAINATLVRSESIDPLCEQTAVLARDALMRTWHRFERTGKLGFDGPALTEVEAGIDLHEQLIKLSTPEQMVVAMREVIRRGHCGEAVS